MNKYLFLFYFVAVNIELSYAGGRELPSLFTQETASTIAVDTIPYKNRPGSNPERDKKNPFDLKDPKSIDKEVDYDPTTGDYSIKEKVGSDYYKNPSTLSFDEYMAYKARQQDNDYFKLKSGVSAPSRNRFSSALDPIKKLDLKKNLTDRLFGAGGITVEPHGNVDMTVGFNYNLSDNPLITPVKNRSQLSPDFGMKIQLEVSASIGDKLKLSTNYNTQSTFDFDNKLKLAYDSEKFTEDDIIKKIEAGNVALPLRSTLIQGSQNLFGFKTEWQFGHLKITGLLAQQRAKHEAIKTKGGGIFQEYSIRPDGFDDNRHFFLCHYLRNSYEQALSTLPEINSKFRLKNIEVWITDEGNNTRDLNVRDIVAIADLGTAEFGQFDMDSMKRGQYILANPPHDHNGVALPTNNSNALLDKILSDPSISRSSIQVVSQLTNFGLSQGRDFEKVRARRLNSSEYTFNTELGFISLRTRPKPNQILAVSYQYTFDGRDEDPKTKTKYKLGEFSSETSSDSLNSKVVYTKLLKSSNQVTTLPSYDLMMKNVYPIGGYNLNQEGFSFDIFYESQDGVQRRFIEEIKGYPLLNLFKLDNLNKTNDPQPDGIFDWVSGQTVIPQNGAIVFPVLEPFGASLLKLIKNVETDPIKAQAIYDKYQYEDLYRKSITKARQQLGANQFLLKGSYKGGKSNEIPFNTFGNDPNAKIIVRAGSLVLTENVDYIVDRGQGKVTILNESYLTGDAGITVDFENNAAFNIQTRSMVGMRVEYAKNKDFYVGSTFMNLFERPFTQKVNLNEDPINNKIFGVDFGYTKSAPWLTRALNNLPLYSTKEASKISLQGEAAYLKPGYAKAINQTGSSGGVIYIDDFEGSSTGIALYFNPTQWIHSSVPTSSQMGLTFKGNTVINNLFTSSNRALLSWYRIDPYARSNAPDANNSYSRLVEETEIFPNRQRPIGFQQELTFDLSYYPRDKGPYNYDIPGGRSNGLGQSTAGINSENKLEMPETRWAGIMTKLNTNDFEVANVEYIDFWLLDPYLPKFNPNDPISAETGSLYLQLGNFSEDILKDGIAQFENALPTKKNPTPTITTPFGKITRTPPLINNFDLVERDQQDLGLDGLSSKTGNEEQIHFQASYLDYLKNLPSSVYTQVAKDPSNDDYVSYRDNKFPPNTTVLEKYKRNSLLEGNSLIDANNQFTTAATGIPDQEDLNNDKTLNEIESYYSYKVDFKKDANGNLDSKWITESISKIQNNVTEKWYRFRIPITKHDFSEGPISDFRSIQSMRMIVTGFTENVTLRFIKLQLGRNTWRRDSSLCKGDQSNDLVLDKIDIEENGGKLPFNYVSPKGIQRQQLFGSTTTSVLANEASLLLRKVNLLPRCTQTVTKITDQENLDMRRYERFKMFVHAEEFNSSIKDDDLKVFLRIGKDFTANYYEYEIPLKISRDPAMNVKNPEEIWKKENDFDFPLELLTNLKKERDKNGIPFNTVFSMPDPDKPNNIVKIVGNPNIANVRGLVIGMRNSTDQNINGVELWFNEMRLTGINNHGGYAAVARAEAQLADLGNLSLAGAYTSTGYGGIEDKLFQRSLADVKQLDATTSIELGKFIPKSASISIPFTAQYSVNTKTPEYDPNNLDLKLKDELKDASSQNVKDSIRGKAIDFTSTKGFAFNNVRKNRTGNSKAKPWDVENFSLSYGQSNTTKHNPIILEDQLNTKKGALDYNFSLTSKYIQPFKFIKSKYLKLISEFNFNPIPSNFSVRNNLDRRKAVTVYRFAEPNFASWETVKFGWLRDYTMSWDLAKSLKVNYSAQVEAVVDEITYNPLKQSYVNPVTQRSVSESDKKPFLLDNIKNFGRLRDFKHSISANYTLPIKYIPGMDWITSKIQYNSNYSWSSGSLNQKDSLGSVIGNGQTLILSGEFNFTSLYNKWSYLKRISEDSEVNRSKPKPVKSKTAGNNGVGIKDPKKKEPPMRKISLTEKILIRPFLLVRKLQLNYSENVSTIIPGFMPNLSILGQSKGFKAPGWNFIAGITPDLNPGGFLDRAADNGWISRSTNLNREVIQRNTKVFGSKGRVELFKGFNLDLNLDRSFTKDKTETFKYSEIDCSGAFQYQHLTPYLNGQYSISYVSIKTLFNNNIDTLFKQFERSRDIVSSRYASQYGITDRDSLNKNYYKGFTGSNQDVIVSTFLASYSGKDPHTSQLDLFKTAPLPNWQLNYSGLSKLKIFKGFFQDFTIRHAYKNILTVNSYRTNLDYRENSVGAPIVYKPDSVSLNYYSRYEIPGIVIDEQFNPMIGINIKTKTGLDLGFDFSKKRKLELKSTFGQLEERRSTEYVVKAAYVIKNVYLKFIPGSQKIKKPVKKLKKGQTIEEAKAKLPKGNDINISLDFGIRDNIGKIHQIDDNSLSRTFEGSRQITFTPALKYNLNKNLNLRLFVDYSKQIPYVSTAFKNVRMAGGLTIQFLIN